MDGGVALSSAAFYFHLEFEVGSKPYLVFCTMERRLLKIIMLPSILLTFLFGILLAFSAQTWTSPWFHVKLLLIVLLAGFHGYLFTDPKGYAAGKIPSLSRKTLVVLNELPFYSCNRDRLFSFSEAEILSEPSMGQAPWYLGRQRRGQAVCVKF